MSLDTYLTLNILILKINMYFTKIEKEGSI